MSRRVHGSTDSLSGRCGRFGQLRAREGARLTERRARAVFRPQESLHTAAGHRPTYHQQGKCLTRFICLTL